MIKYCFTRNLNLSFLNFLLHENMFYKNYNFNIDILKKSKWLHSHFKIVGLILIFWALALKKREKHFQVCGLKLTTSFQKNEITPIQEPSFQMLLVLNKKKLSIKGLTKTGINVKQVDWVWFRQIMIKIAFEFINIWLGLLPILLSEWFFKIFFNGNIFVDF